MIFYFLSVFCLIYVVILAYSAYKAKLDYKNIDNGDAVRVYAFDDDYFLAVTHVSSDGRKFYLDPDTNKMVEFTALDIFHGHISVAYRD